MSKRKELRQSFSINKKSVDTKTVFYRLGGSGTKTNNGYIYEEYNDKIKDKKTRQDTYLQMDNDSTVFELRNAINLAKLSTNFFVDPFKDEE